MKASPEIESLYQSHCPEGRYKFSRHRLETINTAPTEVHGISVETMRCKLCGATANTFLDRNVLAGIF